MSDQITKHGKSADAFDRDSWETPQWLFDWLNETFCFTLDAAANTDNYKCFRFCTPEQSGLEKDWGQETVYCNPPYSRGMKKKFLDKARSEKQATSVFVVPALPSEGWFPHDASMIIWITGGRVGFVNPLTGEENPNPPSGTCVVIFSPLHFGTTTYTTVDRDWETSFTW